MNESAVIIKLKRRCNGTTQAQVARDLGVSQAYLSDVLRGRRQPGPAILKALGLDRRTIYEPTNG